MGILVKGIWHDKWYDTKSTEGEFVRFDSYFRNTISHNLQESKYQVEAGRYHLFVSLACPWAHRVLIMRKLKKLESIIGVTIVKAEMMQNGWELEEGVTNPIKGNPIEGIRFLHEVYTKAVPDYSGRVTVPVLWDTKTQSIVNNESSEIIRIFNSAFNDFTEVKTDYYPTLLRADIDETNQFVYDNINNGVYRAGFATTQAAYEKAVYKLFSALDVLEERLATQNYLVGDSITEADWRLFTTLIRFDAVYVGHFKTNLRTIESYPHLSNYLRDLFQQGDVKETVNFEHIKTHYYYSHTMINPTGIVPVGPEIDYLRPHNRHQLSRAA